MAKLSECLDKASTTYGMEISAEKTKLMTNNTSGINTEIKVNGLKLETVTSFKYLGSVITEDLLTVVKRRKLQWYGHVSRSSSLAKTIVQGTVKGGRRQGRQRKRGGKTTSGNGQAWSSASPRGQWRTGKNGENWFQNHLWCPNDPRGYGIDDDDAFTNHVCSLCDCFVLNVVTSFDSQTLSGAFGVKGVKLHLLA